MLKKYLYLSGITFFLIILILVIRYDTANPWIYYMFYMLASTSFLAIPHEPLVLHYGQEYGALFPLLFALIPTALGCFLDYRILQPLFRLKKLSRIFSHKISRRLIDFFNVKPFAAIFLAALSPVPFYPVRLLSIVSGYSAEKYAGAVLLGRLPRYFFLAAAGQLLGVSPAAMTVLVVVIFTWYLIMLMGKIRTGRVLIKNLAESKE